MRNEDPAHGRRSRSPTVLVYSLVSILRILTILIWQEDASHAGRRTSRSQSSTRSETQALASRRRPSTSPVGLESRLGGRREGQGLRSSRSRSGSRLVITHVNSSIQRKAVNFLLFGRRDRLVLEGQPVDHDHQGARELWGAPPETRRVAQIRRAPGMDRKLHSILKPMASSLLARRTKRYANVLKGLLRFQRY